MCGPLALAAAPAAVSAGGAIMGFLGQNQAAADNTRAANLGFANTTDVLNTRSAQLDQKQSQDFLQSEIQRAGAEGAISASASSFGGDAASTTRGVQSTGASLGRQLGVENLNTEDQRLQVGEDRTSADFARASQINKVQPGNPLALGLSLAGTAASAAGDFSKLGGKF